MSRNRKKYTKHSKQYRIDNRNKISEYNRKWREEHPEYGRQHRDKYSYNYSNEYYRQWREDNPERQAVITAKQKHKRRSLGFYPLNKYIEGSHAHHISENFVIYIPVEIHNSIRHNIWTGKNMEQINKLAVSFL